MKNYIIPSKRYDNDLVILHVGTNDLRHQTAAKEIAREILELAIATKNEKNEIMISGIVPKRHNLNENAMEVNHFLQNFITDANVNKDTHLNLSGLRLNHHGGNFVEAIRL